MAHNLRNGMVSGLKDRLTACLHAFRLIHACTGILGPPTSERGYRQAYSVSATCSARRVAAEEVVGAERA